MKKAKAPRAQTRKRAPKLDNKVVPVAWLRTQFDYDPLTGLITNTDKRHKKASPGADPCYPIPRGYLALKVYYGGIRYTFLAHRLAYALHFGFHPTAEVDHEDHNRTNNRIKNLRDATRVQQNASRRTKVRALPKGISYIARNRSKPYRAVIAHKSRNEHIGCFAELADAVVAYNARARDIYGEFAILAEMPPVGVDMAQLTEPEDVLPEEMGAGLA